MKSSPGVRLPRGRRGSAATITALLGVLVFAAAATEAISLAVNGRALALNAADVAKFARDTDVGDTITLVVAIAAFAVGVVLVLAAIVPARRRLVELDERDENVAAGLTVRSFRRTLAAAAASIDGVSDATVTGRRRIKVSAETSLRDTGSLPDRIAECVTGRLNELNPATPRTVRVVLKRKDD